MSMSENVIFKNDLHIYQYLYSIYYVLICIVTNKYNILPQSMNHVSEHDEKYAGKGNNSFFAHSYDSCNADGKL